MKQVAKTINLCKTLADVVENGISSLNIKGLTEEQIDEVYRRAEAIRSEAQKLLSELQKS
jgi:hypothetical protein